MSSTFWLIAFIEGKKKKIRAFATSFLYPDDICKYALSKWKIKQKGRRNKNLAEQ